MDPSLEKTKKTLRREAIGIREGLPMEAISGQLCHRLASHPSVEAARHLILYFPIGSEVNLLGLIPKHPEKTVYLPRITPENNMVFLAYRPGNRLTTNRYGIAEPEENCPVYTPHLGPTAIILPGLMADKRGYRLGYGKSYYDRFLARMGQNEAISTLIALPHALLVEALPTDSWDIPVQHVVTETETLQVF